MTLAEVKTQSKTTVTMTIFLVLAKTTPVNTAIGTHAKMKNLYMSHGFGVITRITGISRRRTIVAFKVSLPDFTKETTAATRGIPRFKR